MSNVSLVDGHIDEPMVDAFETTMTDGTVAGWADAKGIPPVFVGKEISPFAVRIDKCDEVIFRVGEIEVKANFTEYIPLDKIETIIINGHKFVRDRGDTE